MIAIIVRKLLTMKLRLPSLLLTAVLAVFSHVGYQANAADLSWNVSSGNWTYDPYETSPWAGGAIFTPNDNVTFGTLSGKNAATVTLMGNMDAGSLLFDSNSTAYTVNGSNYNNTEGGGIRGNTGLIKTGSADLRFNILTNLNFTGDVEIQKGKLLWGNGNAGNGERTISMGQGRIIMSDNTTLHMAFNSGKNQSNVSITNQLVMGDKTSFGVTDGGVNLAGGLKVEGSSVWEASMATSKWAGIDLRISGELLGNSSAVLTISGSGENSAKNNRLILTAANRYEGRIILTGGTGITKDKEVSHTVLDIEHSLAAQYATIELKSTAENGLALIAINKDLINPVIGGIDSDSRSEVRYEGEGTWLTINSLRDSNFKGKLVAPNLSVEKAGKGTFTMNGQRNFKDLAVIDGTLVMSGNRLALGTGYIWNEAWVVFDISGSDVIHNPIYGGGIFEKRGAGMIQLDGLNDGFGGLMYVASGTLAATNSTSFGVGTVFLESGILDFGNIDAIDADIVINKGILLATGNLTYGNFIIDQVTPGSIQMGGLDASLLVDIDTGKSIVPGDDNAAIITELKGDGNIDSWSRLGMSSQMVSADDSQADGAAIQFDGEGSLVFEDLGITLTDAAATKLIDAVGTTPQYLHLSNVSTTITGGLFFELPYHAISWFYDAESHTDNGWLKLNFTDNGSRRLLVKSGEVFRVDVYNQFGYDDFAGVTNNGKMELWLGDAASATDGLVIKDLEGSNPNAVINSSSSTSGSRIILTDDGIHTESLYQGSITGNAQIRKDGSPGYTLTINGSVSSSGLEVDAGTLILNGIAKVNGDAAIKTGANLTLNGPSAEISGTSIVNGTLALGENNTYTTPTLEGAGQVRLNNSVFNLVTAAIQDVQFTGTGTLNILNGDLALGSTGSLGGSVILNLHEGTSFTVANANNDRNTLGGLMGSGVLNMAEGILKIQDQGGEFYGNIVTTSSSPSVIEYSGAHVQTINGKGNGNVDINQTGSGRFVLKHESGMSYRELTAANGTLEIANHLDASSLTINSGASFISSVTSQSQVSSTVSVDHLTLNGGGKTTVEFDAATAASGTGIYQVANSLTGPASGKFDITVNGGGNPFDWQNDSYTLHVIDAPGALDADNYQISMGRYLYALGYEETGYRFDTGVQVHLRSTGVNTMEQFANSGNTMEAVNTIWNSRYQAKKDGMLNQIYTAMINQMVASSVDSASINSSLASFAGSSTTALLGATRDGLNQQTNALRNRISQMGLSQGNVYQDLPYYNAWIQGNGGWNKLSQDGDNAGYEVDTWGGTIGFDVNVSSSVTIGAAITANHSKIKTKAFDIGSGDNDACYANVFMRGQFKKWTHVVILTGSWNKANMDRTINIAGMDPLSSDGSTDGSSYGAYYELAYDIALNRDKTAVFQPLVNASIYRTSLDSYSESGAGDASMNVDDLEATHGRAGIGGRVIGLLGSSNIFGREALGEFRVQVAQDYGDETHKATVTPIGMPGSPMKIEGAKAGRTGFQIGGGLSIPVDMKGTIFFDLDADIRSRATNVSGSVGYRYNF